jgi:hypothetical protein
MDTAVTEIRREKKKKTVDCAKNKWEEEDDAVYYLYLI